MVRKALSLVLFLAVVVSAPAARAQSVDIGQTIYGQYCATCHGMAGEGDGPLSAYLTADVPDLTGLAERNNGTFPMLEMVEIIDGRMQLRGHGGAMPTYGAVFRTEAGVNGDDDARGNLVARGRIMSVALYLQELQK